MDPDFDPYLSVGSATVDERDVALVRAVGREGSLNAAAAALDRSYSRAHRRLGTLEGELGTLLERQRGGADGGGSELTDAARALLATYDDLAAALDGTAATEHATLVGDVVDREGELATVDTPAGAVQAIYEGEAGRVRVRFPADAVTLTVPDRAPPHSAISARNRFEGEVTDVHIGTAIATVSIEVGASVPLIVTLTRTSVEALDLGLETSVVATVKATATHAIPFSTPAGESADESGRPVHNR